MKPQKQINIHWPEVGMFGDCHRTAIAIMLDMDAKDVPHFMDGTIGKGAAPGAHEAAEVWLRERGFTQICIAFPGECDIASILSAVSKNSAPGLPYIFGGESKTGVNHSVIACDGEIVCDPSLTESGIIGPMDDGFYWVTFFGAASIIHAPKTEASAHWCGEESSKAP